MSGKPFRPLAALPLAFFLLLASCMNTPSPTESTASRTSGVAPLAVFFDATGSSGGAGERAFHELDYRWDFGDETSGAWRRWDGGGWVSGDRPKNEASGPLASHVFERAGTYTVTLQVMAPDGAVSQRAVQITVSDPAVVYGGEKTVCVSTTGDYGGCPSGARRVRTSDFDQARGYAQPGTRVLLRRGERWTLGRTATLSGAGPVTLSAYGTGERPRIVTTAAVATLGFKLATD